MTTAVLIVVSLALAALRIVGVKHIAFQAAAHLFVGGLIGAWIVDRKPLLMWLVVLLSVVEVGCFLWFKFLGTDGILWPRT